MKPNLSGTHFDTASHMESVCGERLRALVRGEFSEEDFISEFATVPEHIADSEWDLAEWINRQHNSGQVPDALFHSLESKIALLDLDDVDDGATAELYPRGRRRRSRPPEFIEGPRALSRRVIESGAVLRDRYVIEARLGTGGMGTVYKALDKFRGDLAESNRHVAIKILNDDITNRPEVFAKLRREFYCAQSLSHRNIVRVYELDRDGDLAFFTMEFLEGEPLNKIIGRFAPGTVTRSYAWRVMREVGAALAHAHARDVVHADLKPQNVLITLSGDVRLLDFGTSSANVRLNPPQEPGQSAWKFGPTALTPAYASCELLEGRRPEPRDDLFAFACLTYELLTGQHPFGQRRSTEARAQGVKPARPANVGDQQWKILSLGLAFNRADRSMAVRDWVLALNQADEVPALLETQPVLVRAPPAHIEAANAPSVAAQTAAAAASPAADLDVGVDTLGTAAPDATDPAVPALAEPTDEATTSSPVVSEDAPLAADATPMRLPPSALRWMLIGVVVLASLVIFAVSRRPGATAPVAAPAVALDVTPSAAAALPAAAPEVVPSAAAEPAPGAAVPAAPAVAPPPMVAAAPVTAPSPPDVAPASAVATTPVQQAPVPASKRLVKSPTGRPAQKLAAAHAKAAKVAKVAKVARAPQPPALPAIGIERPKYWVRYGRHFAEVHVVRSAGTRGDASFVWWTEPGSARPDEDFLMQMKTTQTFSSGVRMATLFVRIVPNPLRRAPRTFYVQIGHPSPGQVVGSLTKVPILLLPPGR